MKTIRIPQGNEFSLFVPVVLAGNDLIDPTQVTELEVVTKQTNGVEVESSVVLQDDLAVVSFAELLEKGSYDVLLTGKYDGRQWAIPLNNVFAICSWANDATFARKITPEMVTTDVQPIVGWWISDAELAELKAQYRSAIAAEQAATDALEQKVAMLNGVAQENTLTQGVDAIRADIAGIDIDTSGLAKQGTNAAATNSVILADIRSRVAQEANATANKEAIIAAIPSVADVQNGLATENAATANKQEILQAVQAGGGSVYPTIEMTATTASIDPNKVYIWGEVANLDITLNAGQAGVANVYFIEFFSGEPKTTLTLPASVTDVVGVIKAGELINVAIFNNKAYIV